MLQAKGRIIMRLERSWHLIQYDIRDARRLRRVYRYLKSQAFPVQASVFVWFGNANELAVMQQQLRERINEREDDLRGYRLHHPLLLFGVLPFTSDVHGEAFPPFVHSSRAGLAEIGNRWGKSSEIDVKSY